MNQLGLFDLDEHRTRLSLLGDQLEAFGPDADFELLRPELETVFPTVAAPMAGVRRSTL